MYRFENPYYFISVAILLLLILFFISRINKKNKQIKSLGDETLIGRLIPEMSNFKHKLKFSAIIFGLFIVIIALANPQRGIRKEKVTVKSADIFIALDVSNSMLSDDLKPNRLEKAKSLAQKILLELKGERVGVIIFAGNAYIQMPLTTDYTAASLFLEAANPGQVGTQGTSLSDVMEIAQKGFGTENKSYKMLLILTDGEDHEPNAITKAKESLENNTLIFTLGIGTPNGGKIPINYGGNIEYKKDKSGNEIITKVNEPLLASIAKEGGGLYFNYLNAGDFVEKLKSQTSKLGKRDFEQRTFNEYESYYQYFLIFAILIFIAEFLFNYKQKALLPKWKIFQRD
jgi:Ca-activated chloride channel homolog